MKAVIGSVIGTYCLITLCVAYSMPCHGQERTAEEIVDSVYDFFTNMNGRPPFLKVPSSSPQNMGVDISPIVRDSTTYLYSVNLPNGGWALVSNERQYTPILGYGKEGFFSTDSADMPPALDDLLHHHMNMIDSLRKDGAEVFYNRKAAVTSHHVSTSSSYTIGDTLLCKNGQYLSWMQTSNNGICYTSNETDPCCERVYNKYCPTNINIGCGHIRAGCGAVAMGQLMCYWGWPSQAIIPDTIHNQFFCLCGVPSDSRSVHYYDWEHMPARLTNYTDIYDADNIAKLLRDCGYAAQTYYTNDGSAAMMEKIDVAMRETFHYHAAFVVERSWVDVASIIKTDIDALRPVMSQAWKWEAGEDPSIHTFLIDGYNNDMYHINWGWGTRRGCNDWYDLGFDGYTGFRNFLTEIYPDCSILPETIICPDTTIVAGGILTLYSSNQIIVGGNNRNVIVNNGGHFIAQTGDSIVLRPGFHAAQGSFVHLTIDDICDASGSYILHAPNQIIKYQDNYSDNHPSSAAIHDAYLNVSPNPVNSILHIHTTDELSEVQIFTLNGQRVMQAAQTDIDVSNLPQGMYLLRALTTDGKNHQAKFIRE